MLTSVFTALAVGSSLASLADESATKLENKALTTLVAWGGSNLLVGAAGAWIADDPQQEAFHTMNAGWGSVNLALGLVGTASTRRSLTDAERHERWLRLPSIFAFNAGLDVAYIGTGVWLWQTGTTSDDPVRQGWGQSLILQGSALMVFDLWMARKFNESNAQIWLSGSPSGASLHGQF